MDVIDALNVAALRDVYFSRKKLDGVDPDYFFRRVFRWYSEKFATPLHQVPDLPLYDVLTAYYESQFEELEDQELEQAAARAAISDEEQRRIDREKDRTDALDLEDIELTRAHNAKIASAKKVEDVVGPAFNALSDLVRQVREASGGRESALVQTAPRAPAAAASKLPPDIKMTFVDEAEMERELNADPLSLFAEQQRKRP